MCHVLIVEDEPMIAMMIQDALEDAGATSFAFAATEREAVRLALDHAPAFITADVRLAEGTGVGAVANIRQVIGDVPTLFITGTPDACSSSCVASAVLIKPVTAGQVRIAFKQVSQG